MGFCLFNNVAAGAQYLVRNHGLSRVAIVDIDVHHGNGTQHLFESRSDVFYVSLHERPASLPFPGSGHADEVGLGPGKGYTLNVLLDRGSGPAEYLAALDDAVCPAVDRYRPQFLLISAGFDALMGDTISSISLEPGSFGLITERLVQLAERHCNGKLVSILEGGYDLSTLGPAVVEHIRALANDAPPNSY
jgi:acetoin utilization deacetylase AcuC-like enzyme